MYIISPLDTLFLSIFSGERKIIFEINFKILKLTKKLK